MISRLRAIGGAGFDLAQPSQDRITGPQQEFGIYKPMDLCKAGVKGKTAVRLKRPTLLAFASGKDQKAYTVLLEAVGAMMWDTGACKLTGEKPEFQCIAPKSGALGWIDTFAIPAKGRNDAAAYAWINFNMRPEIAVKVAGAAGHFTASQGAE